MQFRSLCLALVLVATDALQEAPARPPAGNIVRALKIAREDGASIDREFEEFEKPAWPVAKVGESLEARELAAAGGKALPDPPAARVLGPSQTSTDLKSLEARELAAAEGKLTEEDAERMMPTLSILRPKTTPKARLAKLLPAQGPTTEKLAEKVARKLREKQQKRQHERAEKNEKLEKFEDQLGKAVAQKLKEKRVEEERRLAEAQERLGRQGWPHASGKQAAVSTDASQGARFKAMRLPHAGAKADVDAKVEDEGHDAGDTEDGREDHPADEKLALTRDREVEEDRDEDEDQDAEDDQDADANGDAEDDQDADEDQDQDQDKDQDKDKDVDEDQDADNDRDDGEDRHAEEEDEED